MAEFQPRSQELPSADSKVRALSTPFSTLRRAPHGAVSSHAHAERSALSGPYCRRFAPRALSGARAATPARVVARVERTAFRTSTYAVWSKIASLSRSAELSVRRFRETKLAQRATRLGAPEMEESPEVLW